MVFVQPLRASSRAISPAAAMMPACRQAAPNRIFIRLASLMKSESPTSIEPMGAPRPLDRQNIIALTSAA